MTEKKVGNLNLIKPSPFDWTKEFVLSYEAAAKISDPDWIYKDLIIQGHVIAIIAEPNGGKTTLMFSVAGEIAKDYKVYYVNADVAGGDAKSMVYEAKQKCFSLLLPDMTSRSMQDVVDNLQAMNKQDGDYSDCVFIFDTLKKMADVISKARSKELYKLLRSLSAKGMTIVLLGHTNKHKDAEGNPVFEGTGDLRADVDELIYLIPEKRSDGSMIVSTKPDKVRGAFSPLSFEISTDRIVERLSGYVDTTLARKEKEQIGKDSTAIELITEAIQSGKCKQGEIVLYCKEQGLGWRTVEGVLRRYAKDNYQGFKPLWRREKSFEKNAWNYLLDR